MIATRVIAGNGRSRRRRHSEQLAEDPPTELDRIRELENGSDGRFGSACEELDEGAQAVAAASSAGGADSNDGLRRRRWPIGPDDERDRLAGVGIARGDPRSAAEHERDAE